MENWLQMIAYIWLFLFTFLSQAQTQEQQGLPEYARSILDLKVVHHGPNCFNAAMIGSGLSNSIRHVSSSELNFLLKSPFCKKISSQSAQFGDLQVFYRQLPGLDEGTQIAHANVWLNSQFAFNKMTQYLASPYQITSHAQVLEKYKYFSEIIIFNVPLPEGGFRQVRCPKNTICETQIQMYRCKKDIFSQMRKNTKNALLLHLMTDVQGLESELQDLLVTAGSDLSPLRSKLTSLSEALKKQSFQCNEDAFIGRYLTEVLSSIEKQLDY